MKRIGLACLVMAMFCGSAVAGTFVELTNTRLDSDSLNAAGHDGDTLLIAANVDDDYVDTDTSLAIMSLYWENASAVFHCFGDGEDGSDSSDYVIHWQGSLDGITWALLDSTVAITDSLPHVHAISMANPMQYFRAILLARTGNLKDGNSYAVIDVYARGTVNK